MKYALVTGSTRGIGKAIADRLAREGYSVFRNGRGDGNGTDSYIQADVSTFAGVKYLAEKVLEQTDRLDCLILNVGITCRKPLAGITADDWYRVMDANVNMPFFLVQYLAGHLAENGSILFISSTLSLRPHATSIPYGVSKAASNMLAQCLVKEFAGKRIRVNVVCPGFIDTQWQREKPDWLRKKIVGKTALDRFGTPEEIADMCLHICQNTFINGAVVSVDGGYDML